MLRTLRVALKTDLSSKTSNQLRSRAGTEKNVWYCDKTRCDVCIRWHICCTKDSAVVKTIKV